MNTATYIILGIFALLVLIRILLPFIAVRIANTKLNSIEGIRGSIKSIKLNLFGGVFKIHQLTIAKRDDQSGIETIIAKIESLEVMIPLTKLIKKKFAGQINIVNPEITYVSVIETLKVKKPKHSLPSPAVISPLKTALEKLPLVGIDVTIVNGQVRYINHTSKTKIDVTVSAINIDVKDFSNQQNVADTATIQASANIYGGHLSADINLKPMREQLTFDVKLELANADMVELNPFFETFANIDVNAGTLGVYLEMSAEHGAFKGYLKPILKDIDLVGAEDSDDSIFKRMWERGVAALFQLLENNRTDQLATKIPFEGRLDDPHVNIGAAIAGVLRNAFVRAIRPSFETTFSFESVYKTTRGFFSRLFNNQKD